MVMQRTNPLADVLRPSRADLAGIVTTISIDLETSSEVTEYPLESGRSVADHTTALPTRLLIAGRVRDGALGGDGAREVDAELRRLLATGVRVDVATPNGVWENCVITRVQSDVRSDNLRALDFRVEFTQVQIADVQTVGTLPIYLEYTVDQVFKDALEEAEVDATSSVTEDIPDEAVTRVQAQALLAIDRVQLLRDQLDALHLDGIDPASVGYWDAREYARAVLGASSEVWTALENVNPQFVVGGNTWEVPLPTVDDVIAQQDRVRRDEAGNFESLASLRPATFEVEARLRDSRRNVFQLDLDFRYEFADTVGAGGLGSLLQGQERGVWYLSYSGTVGGIGILAGNVGGRRVSRRNIRIVPGMPIKIGDGDDLGLFYAIPRFGVSNAETEIRQYDAFVGVNNQPTRFLFVHVNDPAALIPNIDDPAAVEMLVSQALGGSE